jgi:hypothetical protein
MDLNWTLSTIQHAHYSRTPWHVLPYHTLKMLVTLLTLKASLGYHSSVWYALNYRNLSYLLCFLQLLITILKVSTYSAIHYLMKFSILPPTALVYDWSFHCINTFATVLDQQGRYQKYDQSSFFPYIADAHISIRHILYWHICQEILFYTAITQVLITVSWWLLHTDIFL